LSGRRYIRGQSKEAFKFSIGGKGKLKASRRRARFLREGEARQACRLNNTAARRSRYRIAGTLEEVA